MLDQFIVKLNEKNLCTWYILPLIDLNRESFGSANLRNTYIVTKQRHVAVHVADINLCLHVLHHEHYLRTVMKDGSELIVFYIPDDWEYDFSCFLGGKYSKMTTAAKDKIRERSGLKFEVPDEKGNKITDATLMALEKHPVLRGKWFELLGEHTIITPDMELLSIPRPESFIDIDG